MKRWNLSYVYRFKYFILVIMGIFNWYGCAVEKHTYHGSAYYYPNWFPDGKIVYLENYDRWREEKYFPFGDRYLTLADIWYVCEMDSDGSGQRRIVELPFEWDLGGSYPCVSATNDKIVLGNGSDGIWVLNRDGSGLKKIVEEGCYPDFNPEGTKVVYEKPKKGIWVYDLITGKDSCIISDTLAMMPAWSPDGEKIAYVRGEKEVWILELDSIKKVFESERERVGYPDWNPQSDEIIVGAGISIMINITTLHIDSLRYGGPWKWSPNGSQFVGGLSDIYTINQDGSNLKIIAEAYTKEE